MHICYTLLTVVACIPHTRTLFYTFPSCYKHTHAHPMLCRVVHVTSHGWPYFFNINMARICVVEQKKLLFRYKSVCIYILNYYLESKHLIKD